MTVYCLHRILSNWPLYCHCTGKIFQVIPSIWLSFPHIFWWSSQVLYREHRVEFIGQITTFILLATFLRVPFYWKHQVLHTEKIDPEDVPHRVETCPCYNIILHNVWAACQVRKIAGAHAPGMPGTFSPSPGKRQAIPTCITTLAWRTCQDAWRDR